MISKPAVLVATAVTLAATLAADPALAAHKHRRHAVMHAPAASASAERAPRQFYPNEIEGGVSGNLPFNNQIRKMRDPLNANGAGK